jgi:hypothetical protein
MTELSFSSTSAVVVPKSNSTRTTDRFALEVDLTVIKLSRVLTWSSITEEIWASTISGEAPGYAVTIDACGTSKEGRSSCFSAVADSRPAPITKTVSKPTTERLASEAVASLNKRKSPKVVCFLGQRLTKALTDPIHKGIARFSQLVPSPNGPLG